MTITPTNGSVNLSPHNICVVMPCLVGLGTIKNIRINKSEHNESYKSKTPQGRGPYGETLNSDLDH
jgi:hypothetical protein